MFRQNMDFSPNFDFSWSHHLLLVGKFAIIWAKFFCSSKFRFMDKISIFVQNFGFAQISIFEQDFHFSTKFRFLAQISGQNFDF